MGPHLARWDIMYFSLVKAQVVLVLVQWLLLAKPSQISTLGEKLNIHVVQVYLSYIIKGSFACIKYFHTQFLLFELFYTHVTKNFNILWYQ